MLQRSAWSPARHQNGPRSGAHLGTSPALVRSAKAESPKPAIVRGAFKNIVVDDRLYAGAMHGLLDVIHKLGDKQERVMLFGHNPELTELAHRLSSKITHMPTCAVAEFKFNANSWSSIGKAKLAKVALDYPKKS